jgi:predicted PurR-regulated permease PerM
MTVNIKVENRTIVQIMVVVILFFAALQFISAVQSALTLVFISAFLAIALNPPVTYIAKNVVRGSRTGATAIAYLFVVTIIGLFLWALIPPLVKESSAFIDRVPEYVQEVKESDNYVGEFVDRYELDSEIEEFGSNLADRMGDANGPILSGINRLGAAIVSVLTVLVLTFFMLVEGPYWLNTFWKYQHPDKKKHRQMLVKKMYNVITSYINGQLLVAMLAGFTSLIAMLLLGVPFPLPLAGLVALFGLIPLVGATLGAVTVVAVALFQSVATAVIMAVFFLIYQQIENNVIQPMVQSKTLDLTPLMVLVAVIFGISLGGILGGFVAIPVAAILKILFLDYHDSRLARLKAKEKKQTA